jgi:hypothetical protein
LDAASAWGFSNKMALNMAMAFRDGCGETPRRISQ